MKARIDKFGRLVIPQRLRELASLDAGTEVEIEEQAGRITISPVEQASILTRDDSGILILHAELPGGADPVAIVREERLRRSLGF
jgi:AbrB family looped-hinge helix DNA binding protein